MIRRPRRSVPATLVALVVLAAAALVATATIQHLLGHTPVVSVDTVAGAVVGRSWDDSVVTAAGAASAVLGLVLLAAALLPGTPTVIPLSGAGGRTDAGMYRRTLRKDLTTTAAAADGVSSAALKVGRRRITGTVRSPAKDTDGVGEQVRSLLAERLADIAPARHPRVRIKVTTERSS